MKCVLSFAVFLVAPLAFLNATETQLAAVFCDHAVLQRDHDVWFWGSADSGTRVSVEFAGQTKMVGKTTALHPMDSFKGKWLRTRTRTAIFTIRPTFQRFHFAPMIGPVSQ